MEKKDQENNVVSAELLEEEYEKKTVLSNSDLKKARGRSGKGVKIALCVLAAVLVVGGFFASRLLNKDGGETTVAGPSPTPDQRVELLGRRMSDFDYVVIHLKGGENYTIDSHALLDDKNNVIGKEAGADLIYELVGEPTFSVDPNQAYDLSRYCSSIVANRLAAENVTDLSGYGLSDPACRAEIHYRNGDTEALLFGDPVPTMNDAYYYLAVEGSTSVYMGYATHYKLFTATRNERHAVPANTGMTSADNVQSLLVKRPGQETLEIARKPESDTYLNVSTIEMLQPFKNDANLETAGALFEAAVGIKLEKYAGTLEEVAEVSGLGEDQATLVQATDKSGNVLRYLVGNVAEDGEHTYVCINQTDAYLAKSSTVDFVKDCTPQNVIDRFSGIVYIERVNKVTVETGSEKYELGIERTLDGENQVSQYTFDGEKIDDKTFKKLYQTVIASMVSRVSDDFHLEGDTVLRITYDLNVDPGVYVVEFITYNDDYYAVRRADGLTLYLIKKNQVQSIADALASMRAGEFEG